MKYFPRLILCVFFLCFPSAAYPSSTGSKVASSSQDLGRGSQKGSNAKLYSINNHTGAFSYFLGLTIPKGRGGLTPTTAGLSYSSQRNISWPARGWSVPMVCIHRKTNFGVPTYDNAKDRFFFVGFGSNANLVVVNNESSVLEFQAKIEGHFRKYTFHTQEDRWVIRDKNGLVHNLGGTDASNSTYFARQIVAPGKTFSWCLAKTTDTNGNYIEYTYLDSTSTDTSGSFGKLYPDEILYTGNDNSATPLSPVHKIKFIYEENSGNKNNSLRSGYEVARNKKKLKNITYYLKTLGGFAPRRRLHIAYSILGGNTNGDVVISQVQEEGIGSSGTSQYTHPIKFSYYKNEGVSNPNKTFLDAESISVPASIFQHYLTYAYEDSGSGYTYYLRDFVDLNGDGLKDYVVADAYNPVQTGAGWNGGHTYDSDNDTENKKDTTEWGVYFQKPDGSFTNLYKWRFAKDDCSSKCALRLVSKLGSANSNTLANLIDLDGDSKPDYVQTNKWCKNNGKGFDQCVPLMELTTPYSLTVKNIEINSHVHAFNNSVVTHSLMDMNGDGFVDYVYRDLNQGQMGLKVEYSCFNPFSHCSQSIQHFTSYLFSAFWNNPQGPSIQAGANYPGIYLGYNQYDSGGSLSTREFVDVNGDGLPDLLRGITTTSPSTVVLNYGNGSGFGPDIIDPNIGITNLGFEKTRIDVNTTQDVRFHQLIDADGDGLVDSVGADYGPNGTVSIVVKHNKGKGTFSSPQNWNGGPFIPALRKHYSQKTAGLFGNNYYDKYTTSMFMDLNGDGKPDLIYVDSNGNWKIRKGIYPPPYLLKKIDNSRGLKVEITYKPSTEFNDPASVPPQPNIGYKPLPYSINVVHMIRVENVGSHSNTLTYKYYKGKYDAATKEFRGFGSVRVENPKGRYDFFGYAQGEYTQGILTSHIVQDKHTLKYYVNTYNTIEERVVNASTHPPIKFPFIAQKGVEFLEGLAPPNTIHPDVKRKLFQYKYDAYGNLTHEIDHTWGSCKKTEYKSDTSGGNYIFATKKVELIPNPSYHPDPNYFTEPCANPPERSTLFFHDGSSADSYITKGNLTKTQQCLNQACTLTSDTSLSYDAYGNVVATVDPRGNISTVGYDSFSQTLVNYKQNALGHKQYFQHDYGTGQITSIRGPNATDPNNIATQGEETKFEYDALGRIIKKYVPVFQNNTYVATLSETWDYSNVNATVPIPAYVEKWVRKSFSSSAGYRTRTYFDGKGAVIQTRTNHTNGNGMCSVIDVGYDSIGRKIKMVRPYASQDWYYSSPTWVNVTEYEYDPMNRIKKVIHPGNMGEISYNYLPWRTEVTNEDGKIKTYISNAMGKIAEVVEHENVFLGSFSTFYSYTKWGELAHILGSEGNAIIYTHDRLGRRTERLSMPPGGMIQNSHQYQYDLSGNLSSKIDNNQNMTEYQYDSLNRVDTVLYPSIPFPSVGGNNGGSLSNEYPLGNITYTYDHPSFLHSIGRLSIVTDETGSTQFEYDARGNLAKKSIYVCISGTPSNCNTYRSYEVSMDYHAFGPVHTITYATGSQPTVVKYNFDDAGRISRVYLDSATSKPVFANFLYNPDGTIQQKISPTNGDNPPGFNTTVQYTYNARGFTTSALGHKTSDSSAIFLHSEYSYMNSGNISFYRDLKNGIEISYEYDDLYRLIGMNSEQVGNRSYLYSKSGNITSKTETDPNNYTTTTWSYGYNSPSPYNGYHGTHAATQLSNNYGKTYEYHYGYNGNMKMKEDTSSSGQLWRYYYDVENRLRQVNLVDKSSGNIASETTFQYRYSGARVRKTTKQGGSTTQDKIYVDNAYEHDLQLDKYDVHVYAGGVKLATIRDAENNQLIYQSHKDKVFNTQVTTDAQGEIADQRGYYPFGSEYGYSMGWQNPLSGLEYRFNDKEFDTATGLYYYGARYYEPGLSRWLSSDKYLYEPDSTGTIGNPQEHNLYAFSLNNPVNQYDPDGRKPREDSFSKDEKKTTLGERVLMATALVSAVGTAAAAATYVAGTATANYASSVFMMAVSRANYYYHGLSLLWKLRNVNGPWILRLPVISDVYRIFRPERFMNCASCTASSVQTLSGNITRAVSNMPKGSTNLRYIGKQLKIGGKIMKEISNDINKKISFQISNYASTWKNGGIGFAAGIHSKGQHAFTIVK